MKNSNFLILIVSGFFALQACSNSGSNQAGNADTTDTASVADASNNPQPDPADTASNDKNEFAVKAASAGMMEVQLGQLAQKNAASSRVKNFGAMMVRDHSKANDQLKSIASQKNITLPATLAPEHQQHVSEMQRLTGADFDKHYMDMMTKDHKKDISEFEDAAKDLADPELKSFASQTLPVLRTHLDSAQAINDAIKK